MNFRKTPNSLWPRGHFYFLPTSGLLSSVFLIKKGLVPREPCAASSQCSSRSIFQLSRREREFLFFSFVFRDENESRLMKKGLVPQGALCSARSPTGSKGLFHDMQDLEQNFYHDWTTFQIVCPFHLQIVCHQIKWKACHHTFCVIWTKKGKESYLEMKGLYLCICVCVYLCIFVVRGMCHKLCLLMLTGKLSLSICICVLAFLYLCICVCVYLCIFVLRGMCHKLCLLMLTGKLPVSSASSVSLAGSVRSVIVSSEYLENIHHFDFNSMLLFLFIAQSVDHKWQRTSRTIQKYDC